MFNGVYFVTLVSTMDNELGITVCHSDDDLASLIEHYDKDKFKILSIEAIANFVENYKSFLYRDENLEFGGT